MDGKQDHYRELWKALRAGKEIITQAQAQGAIEGEGADYKVSDFFATDFKYSRYAILRPSYGHIQIIPGKKVEHSTQLNAKNIKRGDIARFFSLLASKGQGDQGSKNPLSPLLSSVK